MKFSFKPYFSLPATATPIRRLFSRSLIFLLIFVTVWAGHLWATVPAVKPPNWYYDITAGEFFDRNPDNTQWLVLENQLTAIVLGQDQLDIFTSDKYFNQVAVQSLKPSETPLTTFATKDINGDGIPEIIAGTAEPGYIYIYNLIQGKWSLNHYDKYVWSAITQITAGKFDGLQKNLLVQNQEGFLFLLKISNESLDIVWKSPTVWRQINTFVVTDIDKDSKDEIIVCYKTGGIGVLKLVNSQIVSVWENFLWGKALALTEGDWDNDGLPEILISTSQKVIYILGSADKSFLFEKRITQFNYIAETLSMNCGKDNNQLFTTDTAGKLHCYEYNSKAQKWLEQFTCQTGRIVQIIPANRRDSFLLWSQNRKLITVNAFKAGQFKLKFNDISLDLTPSALYQNNTVYIAPKAFAKVAELGIAYSENKTVYTINRNQITLEIPKSNPQNYKLNNETYPNQNQFLIMDNNLYLSSESYLKLLNIAMKVEPLTKTITAIPVPAETEAGESPKPFGVESPE